MKKSKYQIWFAVKVLLAVPLILLLYGVSIGPVYGLINSGLFGNTYQASLWTSEFYSPVFALDKLSNNRAVTAYIRLFVAD